MREFESGATRDSDENKIDYEGFLSPLVLRRYGEYMLHHQVQADGKIRPSDNWQKGIPLSVYMKSKFRHFMDTWLYHRTNADTGLLEDSLCAELFNTIGYLHEVLREKQKDTLDKKA